MAAEKKRSTPPQSSSPTSTAPPRRARTPRAEATAAPSPLEVLAQLCAAFLMWLGSPTGGNATPAAVRAARGRLNALERHARAQQSPAPTVAEIAKDFLADMEAAPGMRLTHVLRAQAVLNRFLRWVEQQPATPTVGTLRAPREKSGHDLFSRVAEPDTPASEPTEEPSKDAKPKRVRKPCQPKQPAAPAGTAGAAVLVGTAAEPQRAQAMPPTPWTYAQAVAEAWRLMRRADALLDSVRPKHGEETSEGQEQVRRAHTGLKTALGALILARGDEALGLPALDREPTSAQDAESRIREALEALRALRPAQGRAPAPEHEQANRARGHLWRALSELGLPSQGEALTEEKPATEEDKDAAECDTCGGTFHANHLQRVEGLRGYHCAKCRAELEATLKSPAAARAEESQKASEKQLEERLKDLLFEAGYEHSAGSLPGTWRRGEHTVTIRMDTGHVLWPDGKGKGRLITLEEAVSNAEALVQAAKKPADDQAGRLADGSTFEERMALADKLKSALAALGYKSVSTGPGYQCGYWRDPQRVTVNAETGHVHWSKGDGHGTAHLSLGDALHRAEHEAKAAAPSEPTPPEQPKRRRKKKGMDKPEDGRRPAYTRGPLERRQLKGKIALEQAGGTIAEFHFIEQAEGDRARAEADAQLFTAAADMAELLREQAEMLRQLVEGDGGVATEKLEALLVRTREVLSAGGAL